MIKSRSGGFTLIELLAVITVMGILMLIAIPSINRVIENARKDTFINTAKKYSDSVNTLWGTDNLMCESDDGISYVPSALPEGRYYIEIDTANSSSPVLLEQGGKSSWGSRDIKGYVMVRIEEKQRKYADIDNNTVIDGSDYTLMKLTYNKTYFPSDEVTYKLCDIDGNGLFEVADYEMLKKYLMNKINKFPVGEYYHYRDISFYPVLTDNEHGINSDSEGTIVYSDELRRDDIIMSGSSYSDVQVPAVGLRCYER